VLDPLHENFHATVNVHREDSCETASSYRDRVRDKARQTLYPEEDLVDGSVSRVDDELGDRVHQGPIRQIVVVGDLAVDERHGDVIKRGTAVHKQRADYRKTTAKLGIFYHDEPIIAVRRT